MKNSVAKRMTVFFVLSLCVFVAAIVAVFFGRHISVDYVVGIRIATMIIAFASFVSSAVFSLLVYSHNKTVSMANEDMNQRAEDFRNLQFSSANYSIVGFIDRMLIYCESPRYIERFIKKRIHEFHMVEGDIQIDDVFDHPENYLFLSLKIPFREIEGKMVSHISFAKLKFERDSKQYEFFNPDRDKAMYAYILHNTITKRRNVIINLIVSKGSDFFDAKTTNDFTKIKMALRIRSLLGVEVRGVSELFFTNPLQIEGDGSNTYKINSSNFIIKEMPYITDFLEEYLH